MEVRILVVPPTQNSRPDRDMIEYFSRFGEVTKEWRELDNDNVDVVSFMGGEDVTPSIYGHRNLRSHTNSRRDVFEAGIFRLAKKKNLAVFGICRGAQLANVMSGGTMIQHAQAHYGPPTCVLEGKEYNTVCSHHQIMVPGPNAEVLAWATNTIDAEKVVYDGVLPEIMLDPQDTSRVRVTEVLWYPDRTLCCQSHPEWQTKGEFHTKIWEVFCNLAGFSTAAVEE